MSLIFLQSHNMPHIVKVPGIIIGASAIRAKATHITIQCRSCRNYRPNLPVKPGLEGYTILLYLLSLSYDLLHDHVTNTLYFTYYCQVTYHTTIT